MTNDMFTVGLIFTALDKMSSVVKGMASNAVQDLNKIETKLRTVSESMNRLGKAALGAGLVISGALQKPLAAFKDYEKAQVNLKVSVMQKGGVIDTKQFEQLSNLADQLGKDYMGSTEDFYRMFRILTEQGISAEKILQGVGKAVADFAAVTGEGYSEAALKIAKFQDTLGIAADDMVKFADQASRAKFAFGLETQEIYYAMPYLGGALKQLNMQGLGASESVLRLIGVLTQAGLPASQAGESINQMINRMADFTHRLGKNSKEMKEIREILSGTGIQLDFWNEKGKFQGIENMIKQFEKLKALSEQERIYIGKKLFGDVGGKAVSIFTEKGLEGWRQSGEAMEKQANLAERVAAIQGTLEFKWDSFTGTMTIFAVAIGRAISQGAGLKIVLDKLNDAFAWAAAWIKNHERLSGVIGAVVVGAGAALVLFGALALSIGMIAKATANAIGGLRTFTTILKDGPVWLTLYKEKLMLSLVPMRAVVAQHLAHARAQHLTWAGLKNLAIGFGTTLWGGIKSATDALVILTTRGLAWARWQFLTIGGLKSLGHAFGTVLTSGLKAAIVGIRALNAAFITTPIGWIALTIGTLALVIYKFWSPISGFFKGLFRGIAETLKPLEPIWNVFKKVAPILFPILIPLKLLYNFIKLLLKPVEDTGKAAENMGLRFGRTVGNILNSILSLPAKMLSAGANIITSLYKGMISVTNKPIEAMRGLAQRLRKFLPFSPAKEGPLADLHKVNIIGTIAGTMKPDPMIQAMANATERASRAVSPILQPIKQIAEPAKTAAPLTQPIYQKLQAVKTAASPLTQPIMQSAITPLLSPVKTMPVSDAVKKSASGRATGQGMVIHYSPTVTISGQATEKDKTDFLSILRQHKDEIMRMFEQYKANQERTAWA